jgi:transcriptional regulator with XRE-family HTH domain
LEHQVWSDVETFLRNPEPVLQQPQAKKQVTRREGLLPRKAAERSRVVSLFRRGRLNDADLNAQMDEIGKEETALEAQIDELRGKIGGAGSIGETVSSAGALLAELRKRLDAPVAWKQKRRLIEVLVPGQPKPSALPQSYNTGCGIRVPTELNTVGDHIRRRRLALELLQKDVADQIGVDKCSVFNWETNTVSPDLRCMPAIIRFLGYNPLPEAKGWGERIVRHRTSLGMTQGEAALKIGVDPGTLARWERGEREPASWSLERAVRFLDEAEPGLEARRVG